MAYLLDPARTSIGRAIAVTVGLSALGAMCGALLGGIAILVDLGRDIRFAEVGGVPGAFGLGAALGATFGAVITPVVGWIFLRRVSLGRAIAETTLGTLAGILAASLWPSRPIYLLGFVGFFLAALRLWFTTRRLAKRA